MTPINPHCHETVTLRRQIAGLESELEHRAEMAAIQADRYARLRRVAIRRAKRIEELGHGQEAMFDHALAALARSPRSTCFTSPEDDPAGSGPFGF